jgi:hypothetical protein
MSSEKSNWIIFDAHVVRKMIYAVRGANMGYFAEKTIFGVDNAANSGYTIRAFQRQQVRFVS